MDLTWDDFRDIKARFIGGEIVTVESGHSYRGKIRDITIDRDMVYFDLSDTEYLDRDGWKPDARGFSVSTTMSLSGIRWSTKGSIHFTMPYLGEAVISPAKQEIETEGKIIAMVSGVPDANGVMLSVPSLEYIAETEPGFTLEYLENGQARLWFDKLPREDDGSGQGVLI
jgi:hypothetical protein